MAGFLVFLPFAILISADPGPGYRLAVRKCMDERKRCCRAVNLQMFWFKPNVLDFAWCASCELVDASPAGGDLGAPQRLLGNPKAHCLGNSLSNLHGASFYPAEQKKESACQVGYLVHHLW